MKALRRDPWVGYLDNWLWVPKTAVDTEGVKRALSMRFVDSYSESKIRYVYLWNETEHHLLVPRCLWQPSGMPFRVVDCRQREYMRTGIVSRVKLDHRVVEGKLVPTGEDIQSRAMRALLTTNSGVLQLGCGRGKTVITLHYIARLGGPALILLDNTNLLEQWRLAIEQFLDVPGGVGRIQANVFDWKKGIVLATYHTVGALARDLPEEVRNHFMLVVYDEAHHVAAATFAPSAEVFPGIRLALTATAKRDDGLNVIYDNHIGPTIYKDITHTIKPRIVFKWTGLKPDATSDVYDCNGEVHTSKLSAFFGRWAPRLSIVLNDVEAAVAAGRKVLVLSDSIGEAVNLCALWTARTLGMQVGLYTDIPVPSFLEVGGKGVPPRELASEQRAYSEKTIESLQEELTRVDPDSERGIIIRTRIADLELQLEQDDVHDLVSRELRVRQKAYREWLMKNMTTAGLMIHKVDPKSRMEYIRTKRVVFAITKYGKEGLDDEYLDTVLVSTPFSSRNGLQQLMGRPTRQKPGKKSPLVVIYEDDVGTLIGMCRKLRGHLNHWPLEENGPFEFEMHGHPKARGRSFPPLFEDLWK